MQRGLSRSASVGHNSLSCGLAHPRREEANPKDCEHKAKQARTHGRCRLSRGEERICFDECAKNFEDSLNVLVVAFRAEYLELLLDILAGDCLHLQDSIDDVEHAAVPQLPRANHSSRLRLLKENQQTRMHISEAVEQVGIGDGQREVTIRSLVQLFGQVDLDLLAEDREVCCAIVVLWLSRLAIFPGLTMALVFAPEQFNRMLTGEASEELMALSLRLFGFRIRLHGLVLQ